MTGHFYSPTVYVSTSINPKQEGVELCGAQTTQYKTFWPDVPFVATVQKNNSSSGLELKVMSRITIIKLKIFSCLVTKDQSRHLRIDKPKVISRSQSQKLTTWFSLKSQCPTTPPPCWVPILTKFLVPKIRLKWAEFCERFFQIPKCRKSFDYY